MSEPRTLAVDIGGTGIKAALLDADGVMVGDRVRVPTPPAPVAPEVLAAAIDAAVMPLGGFDRVSVGFPGAVRHGRVLTAPHLGTELWAGFDLQTALAERWGKPVRVMNDADVQGFGAIQGEGVEMVVTLGTGVGTAIFDDGRIMPHLELAHHPLRAGKTYDEYLGNDALHRKGKKKWNKRVARTLGILRTLVNFDHLYIGGGNARAISFKLPPDVTIVPNSDGLTGGIALWRAADAAAAANGHDIETAAAEDARRSTLKRSRIELPGAPEPVIAGAPVAEAPVCDEAQPGEGVPPPAAPAGEAAEAEPLTGTASQPRTAVDFAVPSGACDCHVHVFGTAEKFPFAGERSYTPPAASADELLQLQQALALSRVVIVQPSVYGSDNSCTLDGLRRLGARARGVAVIDDQTTDAALDEFHGAGIRGVRVNLETAGETDPGAAAQRLQQAIERVAPRGWHLQIYTRLSVIASIAGQVTQSPVPVVFDHFGGAQAAAGPEQPGFAELLRLVGAGVAYVKLSAAYRSSPRAPDYADVASLARALIEANPERMLWGTDWPHPHHAAPGASLEDIAPFYDIDDGLALNQLGLWAPDAALRRVILVDNPARLYDF